MARPVYPYEMSDPDFVWLLETFHENRPGYVTVQETCLPLVLIAAHNNKPAESLASEDEFQADDPFQRLLLLGHDGEKQAEDQ